MKFRLRAGLGLRIYVVTATTVLVALLGLFLVLRLAWKPQADFGPRFSIPVDAARRLAQRWPSAEAMDEELKRIRVEHGQEDRKSTRLNSSHVLRSRMPSSS